MSRKLFLSIFLLASGISETFAATQPEELLRDSMPASWTITRTHYQTLPTDDKWWRRFDDPQLASLISRAVDNNFNLLAATKRIESARQLWRSTRSAYFPTLSLGAAWQSAQQSGMTSSPARSPVREDYFSLGISMNWELDIFGKITAAAKADKAAYEASEAEYDAVMVSLCSNLATAYFDLRAAQAQLLLNLEDIKAQEGLLKLAETRYECGLVPQVDVIQARVAIQSTQASLPSIKNRISSDINTIALLCGVYPSSLSGLAESKPLPDSPPAGDLGVPADILRRRPDIVQAEKDVARLAALAGVAKKDFLPTLSIAGSIGTSAHSASDLFRSDSFTWQIQPSLTWTIFDGLAREAKIAGAKADLEAGVDRYNLTVMTAVREAENAISSLEAAQNTTVLMDASLKNYRKVYELQLDRYRQGLVDFTDLISARLDCLHAASQLVESRTAELSSLVTLYTALGGGF